MTIEVLICQLAQPDRETRLRAALAAPRERAAEHLREVGAGVEREGEDEALDLAEADAKLRQREVT